MNKYPVSFRTEVSFELIGDRPTKITMRSIFRTAEARDFVINYVGAVEGGQQHLDRTLAIARYGGGRVHVGICPRISSFIRHLILKNLNKAVRYLVSQLAFVSLCE